MPSLPKIPKFRGDNDQPFRIWIQEFQAQLTALGHEEDKFREILLCCCEGKAFSVAIKAIHDSDNKITYKELVERFEQVFCGQDYKRRLESKLRHLQFRQGMKVNSFVTELRTTIKELYDIQDEKAIDSIATNHVVSTLDDTVRDSVRLLQISGHVHLESILELVEAKMTENPYSLSATVSYGAAKPQEPSRLDRIEKLVESLATKVADLSSPSTLASFDRNSVTCEECHKQGHTRSNCFKLKTCFHCNKRGHIQKFCRNKSSMEAAKTSVGQTSADEEWEFDTESVQLEASPRIYINIGLSDKSLKFLYDPGSQYTMIPRNIYDQLSVKPPLSNVNRVGMGITGKKFKFDGVVFLNMRFQNSNISNYEMEYEPILVSSQISTCIFGIHSELRFKAAKRDHDQHFIIFTPRDGPEVKLPYLEEKNDQPCGFIQVAKVTTLPEHDISWVSGKIKGISTNRTSVKDYLFEGHSDLSFEISNMKVDSTSKKVIVPVYNQSSIKHKLKKGVSLGLLTELHTQNTVMTTAFQNDNDIFESMSSTVNLNVDIDNDIQTLISEYQQNIDKVPVSTPAKVPLEHCIDLKDSIPVYSQPGRIPHSRQNKVKDIVDDLLEKDYIEPSRSSYGSRVVPVIKRNGDIRLCYDYRALKEKTVPSISKNGIQPLRSKLNEILKISSPTNVDQLKKFLGVVSYYKKFLPNFPEHASVLYNLLKKKSTFEWFDDSEQAFQTIKQLLCHADLLRFPDYSNHFILQTDTSNTALGFVLSQQECGVLYPIKFGGRTLTGPERNYSVTDKELLGVYYAVKQCEIYLLGYEFIVYTSDLFENF